MGRQPLVLSALGFVVLLVITWWVIRDREEAVPDAFFNLQDRNPDTLTVAFGPDTTVVVHRSEREWQVIRPVEYPADPTVVGSMINQLAGLEVDRVFPLVPEKMDTYGMRFPRGLIRIAYGGNLPPDTLIVGGFAMGGSYDYLRIGSRSEVGMISARITRSYFLKSTLDIRETRLLPFYEPGVVALELRGPAGETRVELERLENTWRVVQPFSGPGNSEVIGEYLKSLNHMHVEAFVREGDGPLEPYALDQPVASARIVLSDGQVFGVDLGSVTPNTDLMHAVTLARPHVLGVSQKYLPVLLRPADAFRHPAPVNFGLDHVDSLHVTGRQGERTFRPGKEKDPDLAKTLEQVLGNLILTRAEGYEAATPSQLRRRGLAPPRGTLVWMGALDTLAVLDIGESDGNHLPIRVSGGRDARIDEILLLPEARVIPLWGYLERTAGAPASGEGDSSAP